jgi:heme/copper-type cytochrome/quinol oxidase subunit 2
MDTITIIIALVLIIQTYFIYRLRNKVTAVETIAMAHERKTDASWLLICEEWTHIYALIQKFNIKPLKGKWSRVQRRLKDHFNVTLAELKDRNIEL